MEQRAIVVSDKCVRTELKLVSAHIVMLESTLIYTFNMQPNITYFRQVLWGFFFIKLIDFSQHSLLCMFTAVFTLSGHFIPKSVLFDNDRYFSKVGE